MTRKSKSVSYESRKKDIPPVEAQFIFDATKSLLEKSLCEGQNRIMRSDSGLELVAKATPSENLRFSIIDPDGFPLEETISITVNETASKKTTCWECGLDAGGDNHCWKVPCPVIVGPWKPGKVMAMGFTFI